MTNESDLLSRALAGDQDAIVKLIEQEQPRLYQLALAIVGNEEGAADMAQEASIRIYERIKSFRGDSKFSTWTAAIVVNQCRSYLRRQQIIRWVSLGVIGDRPVEANVEQMVSRRQRDARLRRNILSLTPKLRIVIVLRYYQDCTCGEIAEMLNIPIRTVHSRLRRAREQLRHMQQSGE